MNVTPERWQHIARIYELVIDQDASRRDTFLSDACAGDEALRHEVESLLRQDAAVGVLDRSVWATAAPLFRDRPYFGPGAALGPYRIECLLGTGGMGQVFRATDTRLNRAVAIKVLPIGVAGDQQMRARFAREARAVAALTHPHICTLYDVGCADNVDFLVMEYLQGPTLAERLTEQPLPLDLGLSHAIEIASALDHAHRHGIVHRDLKPANIMLTTGGAKLLDFGLAKFRAAASAGMQDSDNTQGAAMPVAEGTMPPGGLEGDVSSDGAILGTVRYMPPERIEGRETDARGDLFSFGAVLYEMLTGRRAFDGDTASSVRGAILERESLPLSSLLPLAPPALDDIVRRCLAKNCSDRWATAGDVMRELKRVSESISQSGRRPAADLPRRPVAGRARRWIAAILVGAIAGFAVWLMPDVSLRRSTPASYNQIRSVAVLPLENLSGDPEQEYFADGMTEQLIADLAKVPGLRVISPASIMQYRKAAKPLPVVVEELQVDAIIDGSVVSTGDTVRMTARLIRGTGEVVWAQSYERDLRNVLALQDEMARTIISEIGITLTPLDQARLASTRPTVNPDALRPVLLGRYHAAKATEEGLQKAIQYFDVAIANDPANAMAHAWLSEVYSALCLFYMYRPLETMPKAKRAAEIAVRLDESLADAHAALGYVHLVYDWDGPAAEKELLRALALNPSLPTARLNYAAYLTTQARYDEATVEVRRAVALDPLSIQTHATGISLLLFTKRYDEAIELARKSLEFEPNSAFTLAFLGLAYAELGKFDEAVDNLQRAGQLDSSLTILAFQAHVLAVAGRKEEAEKLVRHVRDTSNNRYFCPYEVGTVYVSLGDLDTAYELFRKGTDEHADCMAWLGVEPWIEPFRSDPRYGSLLREIGLAPNPPR